MAKFLFQADYTAAGIAGLRNEGGTGRKRMFEKMFWTWVGRWKRSTMPLAETTCT